MSSVLCVGIATLDRIFAVDRHPATPGKYRATGRTVAGGGVAANAAVAVARLGGQARFAGVVGDDEAGAMIAESLADEGVDMSRLRVLPGRLSPESIVLVDSSGERLIVNHASEDLFEASEVPTLTEIDRPDVVLTDMRWRRGAVAALAVARDLGVPGVVDCDHDPVVAPGILERASHVVFGQSTLEAWTGSSDPGDALAIASERLDAWVGVTVGSEGSWWLDSGRLEHAPAVEIVAVDTLGAGDVFHGAFALGLAEEMTIREAIEFGSAAAALKCTRFGGRDGIPTRDELERFRTEENR
jgi:sulfofructose kinase